MALIEFRTPKLNVYLIAEPMTFWRPQIEVFDALHLAAALSEGADYLVTNDGQFRTSGKEICARFKTENKLPTGEPYFDLEMLAPTQFADKILTLRRSVSLPSTS